MSEKITMALYESPQKEQNNENYGEFGSECICCGKPMAAGSCQWVHMNEKWQAVNPLLKEDEVEGVTGFRSQGCFPVGNECAKKMKGFTFTSTLEKSHPKYKAK